MKPLIGTKTRRRQALRSRTVVCLAALVLASAFLSAGCGRGEGSRRIVLSGRSWQDSFAYYYPVSAATAGHVSPYTVGGDLSGVVGISSVALSAEARRYLASHGFVAVPGSRGRIDHAYREISAPKFVTLDAVLFSFHCLVARVLHNLERGILAGDIGELARAMLKSLRGFYEEAEGAVREAALVDLAYLGVAVKLLGDEAELPPEAADLADKELALVAGAQGEAVSPLLGVSVDYGVFKPKDRYSRGAGLEGCFQAVTWLGEMGFPIYHGTVAEEIRKGRDMARRAVLLLAALHEAEANGEAAFTVWDRVYQAYAFLSGAVSRFNAYDLTRLTREVFGNGFTLRDLEDDSSVDALISLAAGEGEASSASGSSGQEAGGPRCFRFLGVRERPEGTIFSSLVADKVPGRLLPRGLDLPAALGSERALDILEEVYGEVGKEGYGDGISGLRGMLAATTASPARVDFYQGCREVLRLTLQPRDEGYPMFMRGTAWLDRCLFSFLGSWVELQRDEPAGAEACAGGATVEGAASSPKGYVEPLPEAYAKLAALADVMRRGLRERGLSDPESEGRLEALYGLLLTLKSVSEKELRSEVPTPEEYGAIAGIGETLSFIASLPLQGTEGREQPEADCACAVYDLYHDQVYDEYLQAGTGRPVTCYVIAPVEGRPTLTVGAGFSYYEFAKAASGRYTQGSWREALQAGAPPDPPAWSASFMP